MKCPKCGNKMRSSKKNPGYYLCDTCRKRYPAQSSPISSKNSARKKSRKKKNRSKKLLLIFIIFVIIIFGLYKSGNLPFTASKKPQEEKITTYAATETASFEGLELCINSFKTIDSSDSIQPASGNVFLKLEMQVTNTTDSEITINSVSDFSIYQGDTYLPYSSFAYKILPESSSRLSGTVAAGSSLNGYVCFEVPENWTELQLQFANPVWNNQKISFTLNNSQ